MGSSSAFSMPITSRLHFCFRAEARRVANSSRSPVSKVLKRLNLLRLHHRRRGDGNELDLILVPIICSTIFASSITDLKWHNRKKLQTRLLPTPGKRPRVMKISPFRPRILILDLTSHREITPRSNFGKTESNQHRGRGLAVRWWIGRSAGDGKNMRLRRHDNIERQSARSTLNRFTVVTPNGMD